MTTAKDLLTGLFKHTEFRINLIEMLSKTDPCRVCSRELVKWLTTEGSSLDESSDLLHDMNLYLESADEDVGKLAFKSTTHSKCIGNPCEP